MKKRKRKKEKKKEKKRERKKDGFVYTLNTIFNNCVPETIVKNIVINFSQTSNYSVKVWLRF